MDAGLTEHERGCLEHVRQARAGGMRLSQYAGVHGLSVRMLYDATAQLKKKGMIAGGVNPLGLAKQGCDAKAGAEKSPFVAVRVAPGQASAGCFLPILRLNHVRGHVLEFGSWPPAEVLAVILAGGA